MDISRTSWILMKSLKKIPNREHSLGNALTNSMLYGEWKSKAKIAITSDSRIK